MRKKLHLAEVRKLTDSSMSDFLIAMQILVDDGRIEIDDELNVIIPDQSRAGWIDSLGGRDVRNLTVATMTMLRTASIDEELVASPADYDWRFYYTIARISRMFSEAAEGVTGWHEIVRRIEDRYLLESGFFDTNSRATLEFDQED